MSSVKKNFSYNLILTLCGYIFPLITYPYVSRVLGVQNIGICNFVDSIIQYFVLFSMLGIGSYGVREIARVRKDQNKLNTVFSNLFAINFITSLVSVVVLVVCTYTVPKLVDYRPYLLIGVVKLVFEAFMIGWFFQGIQNFKYITIRSLIVRVLYVVGVFVFVKDSSDTLVYFILTAMVSLINGWINWVYSHHFVQINLRCLDFKPFIIPILIFGYYRILTSMYTTFNTMFLGFSSGDIQVGYFATATKLYTIFLSVLSAFTTVMVPRVSELLHDGKLEKLQWIANQTMSLVTVTSLPIIIYCQFFAADIINLIAGQGYEGAIPPFRIVICLLLIIGFEQILIQQFLMASPNNKPITIVSTVGAIVGVGLNILLTPNLGAEGASVAWGASEFAVLVTGILYVNMNVGVKVPFKSILVDVMWSLLYLLPLYLIYSQNLDVWIRLILSGIVLIVVFFLINLFLHKNQLIVGVISNLINK